MDVDELTHNEEDFSRFFCSELATAGLDQAYAIKDINASVVTPSTFAPLPYTRKTIVNSKAIQKKLKHLTS